MAADSTPVATVASSPAAVVDLTDEPGNVTNLEFEFVNITRLHLLTLVIWTDSPREEGGVEDVVDSPVTHPQDAPTDLGNFKLFKVAYRVAISLLNDLSFLSPLGCR